MRIAAGVLLMAMALFHGCAGSGLVFFGACEATLGQALEKVGQDANQQKPPERLSAERKGTVFAAIGFVMFALLALEILAGIELCRGRNAILVTVVGALGILTSVAFALFSLWLRTRDTGAFPWIALGGTLPISGFAIFCAQRSDYGAPTDK
jgi:hypothetical protein